MIFAALAILLGSTAWAEPSRSIDIGLDPGLELLGVIELLGGEASREKGFAATDTEEMRQTILRFATWRASAERAVAFSTGSSCDFLKRSDALVRLDLTPPPELVARSPIPSEFVDCFGSEQGMRAWLDALRMFAAQARFQEYFEAKNARLAPQVERVRREVTAAGFIAKIERYSGLPFQGTYAMPLSSHHAPGPQINSVITNEDGSTRIVSILGSLPPVDSLLTTAWHELAHGIFDRVSDLYRDDVLRRSAVQKTLPWDCYGGWEQCFKENIVRAVMIRLGSLEKGSRFGEQVLREEGLKKYPYLAALVELLKEYESNRMRYPTLAHFYPRMIAVFPAGPALVQPPQRSIATVEPGANWLSNSAVPFSTVGQRTKALELLDVVLEGRPNPDPDLLLRRGVLRLSHGLYDGARADAKALLSARPGNAAALYLTAIALESQGLEREASAVLSQAAQSCASTGSDIELCQSIAARLALADARRPQPGPAAQTVGRLSFETDPRIELLGVVQMLAEPQAFRLQFSSAPLAYAEYGRMAWKTFEPFAGHPAVAGLKRLRQDGRALEMVSRLLGRSLPPELAAPPVVSDDEMHARDGQFFEELRDFSVRSDFMAFYKKNQSFYGHLRERALKESSLTLRAQSVTSYLRLSLDSRLRFVLTPLLPRAMAANAVVTDTNGKLNARIRPADYDAVSLLDFDDFGASPAHEIGHAVLDQRAIEHREELEAYSGLMFKGCTDTWQGCVLEHVDLAVTLRALAMERGEGAYQRELRKFQSRGYLYLEPLCERLKEWEASSSGAFDKFYPRLVAVFRESLIKSASAQARETFARQTRHVVSAQGESAPAPRIMTESITDPRMELVAALIGLAEQRKPSGPFVSFYSHPAVGMVQRMLLRDEQRALPAQLMLYVSTPPAMALMGAVPENYAIRAGGPAAVAAYFEAARDFAVRANFSKYYLSSVKSYQDLARQHAQRLMSISPSEGQLVVSTLLPARYRARLVRIRESSPPEVLTLMSSSLLGEHGAGNPGAAIEIKMAVDPRIELLSILLLFNQRPAAAPQPKSAYQQDAERWFVAFATHPAVAQAAALLKRNPELSLPAAIMLHLSASPEMIAAEPIPSGYIEAAGGAEAVDRFVKAVGDFVRSSRFAAFYEAHRADYENFAAAAKKETTSTISPQAVQGYLGASLSDRYTFILAPLLRDEHSFNLSLRRSDHLEEVRIRSAQYSGERGHRFQFNEFASSLAHVLVHTVINPLASNFNKTDKAPVGCNDQQGKDSWPGCVQEHLVYAITLRIAARELGEKTYRRMLDEHTERGLPYLESLGERLKEYEANRGRYRELRDFYPQLESVFGQPLPKGTYSEPSPADALARQLKDRGVKDFIEGRFTDALLNFTAALKQAPQDCETLLNMGVVYEKLGKKNLALESYGRAIKYSVPGTPRAREIKVAAYSSRATLLLALGRPGEARQDLQHALDASSADSDGRQDLERRLSP